MWALALSASNANFTRIQGWCELGGQTISVLGYTSSTSTPVQASYPSCTVTVYITGGAIGTVNASGTSVIYETGIPFNASGAWNGLTISINSVNYTIASVSSATSLTLTTAVSGTLTGVSYSVASAPAAIYSDANNTVLTNPFTANTNASWYFYAPTSYNVDVQMSGGPNSMPTFTLGDISTSGGGGTGGGLQPPSTGGSGILTGTENLDTTGIATGATILSVLGSSATITINGASCTLGSSCSPSSSPVVSTSLVIKGNGSGGTLAASPGTDYQGGITQTVGLGSVNTNIANTVNACPNGLEICDIQIPVWYPGGDQVAGWSGDINTSDYNAYYTGSNILSNLQIGDMRSNANFALSNCFYQYSNQCYGWARQSVYGSLTSGASNYFDYTQKFTLPSGGNFETTNLSNYEQMLSLFTSRTHGQMIQHGDQLLAFAPSDALDRSIFIGCPGGVGFVYFAEGCEVEDVVLVAGGDASHGSAEPVAPVTSSGTGLNSITLGAFSQGIGQLGEGRYLVDITAGGTANTVTAWTGCTDGGSVPCTAAMGTAVTASTVLAQSTIAITSAGSQTITPTSYQLGSGSGWTVGQLVCLADAGDEPECVKITAVNGSTSFTARFHFTHQASSGAPIYFGQGGMAGYLLEINADRVTNSTYSVPLSGVSVTGTLHLSAWPVIGCSTSTSCLVAVNGKGSWRQIVGNDKWSVSNNAVTLWPSAKVLTTSALGNGQDSSNTGGPVALADNNMSFASGHNLEQFYASGYEMSYGNVGIVNLKGNFINAAGGFGLNFYGVWANNDCLFCIANYTPVSLYAMNGGTYGAPFGLSLTGQFQYALSSEYGGQYGDIDIGCPSSGCGDYQQFLIKHDTAGSDYIGMMGGAGHNYFFVTSSNGAGFTTRFTPTGVEIPGAASNTTPAQVSGDYTIWVNSSTGKVCTTSSTGTVVCSN